MTSPPAAGRPRRGTIAVILVGTAALLAGVLLVGTLTEHAAAGGDGGSGPTSVAGSGPVTAGSGSASPGVGTRYVFPVAGTVSYERSHHDYPATDIIAACGSLVGAATDGVILEVSRTDAYDARFDDGADRGGMFVSILGEDGVRYYGSHLRLVNAAIEPGVRVRAGDPLGEVGSTGRANGICHLHFGISPPCAKVADWWIRRGVVWPWSYLDSWRRGGNASPMAEVATLQQAHGCPTTPPPQ